MKRTIAATALVACTLALCSCGAEATNLAGNSASTGNAQASGTIVNPDGAPASDAWVECRPDSMAAWEPLHGTWSVHTDSLGRFRCNDLPPGKLGVTALQPASGLSSWHAAIASLVPDVSTRDTLEFPGALRVALPPATYGTLDLSGLGRYLPAQGEPIVEFDDVPSGWNGAVRLTTVLTPAAFLDSGHVRSGRVDSSGFTRSRTVLRLPLAGAFASALTQVPLLLRLDSNFTGFVKTLPDGSDLRLSLVNGKALPLTVAAWDRANRTGVLWTLLDTLPAPADSLDLVLEWGIPVLTAAPANAFGTANGWVAAWPLGDTGKVAGERNGLFAGNATALTSVPGIIGRASHFDGRLSQILIPNSSTGALGLPEGGPYTLSCWARLQSFGTSRHLMGHGEQGSYLKFQKNFAGDTNSWLAKDFRTTPVGGYFTMAKADSAVWSHLTMTVSGTIVSLYVNGIRQAIDSGFDGDVIGRKPELFAIGAAADTLGNTAQHFLGDLSEVWVQSVVRSPEWVRLTAANQSATAPVAKILK
jgi:Concanavalin A-like lectin/glucanases superfamily